MINNHLETIEPLIELKGISKTFGKNRVLDNVDLKIYRGEALGIIGPSGTGKSTVGIGMVFQQAALFDSLTVEENIGFLLYQNSRLKRSHIRELVNEKLEMVGLADISHLYPSELSGGMRKRVSFARAIMSNPQRPTDNPEVLLYDEPTAGLDPIASTVIEDLIRSLQHTQGVCSTYAIVTHQESTIRRTSDQIVFLYQGKVQWQGTAVALDHTEEPLIRQFMSGSVNGPIQVAG